jgi:tight adherence protein B
MAWLLWVAFFLMSAALAATMALRAQRKRSVTSRAFAFCRLDTRTADPAQTPTQPGLRKSGITSLTPVHPAILLSVPPAFVLLWAAAGLAIAAMAAGALGLALLWLRRGKDRRNARAFTACLPAFLERVRQLIVSGKTLQQAFLAVSMESEPAIRKVMEPLMRRVQHGAPLPESIETLAREIGTVELHMLAAFVRSNTKFGGRVANCLTVLIGQLSSREKLEREIGAATAETRASATILLGLSLLVICAVSLLNGDYLHFYLGQPSGRTILAGILAWPLMGLIVMRRVLKLSL